MVRRTIVQRGGPSLSRGARVCRVCLALGLTGASLSTAGCGSTPGGAGAPSPAALPECTITLPSPADWRLSAAGTSFQDALGRVVLLRGVDGGGRSKFAPYVPFDYAPGQYAAALGAYMDRAASWGIDVMRVPFTWAALEPTQGQYDDGWLAQYDQLLDAAWARGIYTVLDFHQDVYSEAYCGDGFPGWTLTDPPAPHHDCPDWATEYFNDTDVMTAFDRFWAAGSTVQAEYLSAWDTMVARYKDKPGVLGFEPINEPGWGSAADDTFSATTLTAFYTAMIARMRGEAPASLVFIDVTGEDGALVSTQLQRPAGDEFVFTPHFYPLSSDPTMVQSGLETWANIGRSWNVPVLVDEFGVSNTASTALTFMTAHFAAFDALGLSGSEWEYSVSAESWNSETDSLVAADGTEYPVAGAVLRPYARAVAGSAVTQAYDPAAKSYSLKYAPAAGVTEVSLPARLYPGGYALTVSGACVDAKSAPGRLLLQRDPTAADAGGTVSLTIDPK